MSMSYKIKNSWIALRLFSIFIIFLVKIFSCSARSKLDRIKFAKLLMRSHKKCGKILKINFVMQPHVPLAYFNDKPTIFMSNHQSMVDVTLVSGNFHKNIVFFVKKEYFDMFVFGKLMRLSGAIPVDRHHPEQEKKLKGLAKIKLNEGLMLWAFPEGTRSKTGELLPFKLGVFRLARELGVQIVPVGIQGARDVVKPGSLQFHLNKKVQFNIGKPIDASQYTAATQLELMQTVRAQIQQLMQKRSDDE